MKLPCHYDSTTPTKRRLVRKQYERLQEGKCWHCNQPLESKPVMIVLKHPVKKELFHEHFFDWPIHLHHDHKTGMTVGAVHAYCNAVLWVYHGE